MWAAKIAWWASRHARKVKRNGPGLGGRRGQFEANVMARTMAVICESRATVFQKKWPRAGGSRRGQFTEVPVTVWTMTGVCEGYATIKWPQPKLWLMKTLGRGPVLGGWPDVRPTGPEADEASWKLRDYIAANSALPREILGLLIQSLVWPQPERLGPVSEGGSMQSPRTCNA
jgi:hypothetical protein